MELSNTDAHAATAGDHGAYYPGLFHLNTASRDPLKRALR